MMFINNVETTYPEGGRVMGTIHLLYSLLNIWHGGEKPHPICIFSTDSKALKAQKSEVYKTGISSCYSSF